MCSKARKTGRKTQMTDKKKKTSPTSPSALANISTVKNTGCEDTPTHTGKTKVAAFAQMFW